MIQIERRALGSLEQNVLPAPKGVEDLEPRIRREPMQALSGHQGFLDHRPYVSGELPPQQRDTPTGPLDSFLDERCDPIGVHEIGNPKTPTARFVLIRRANASTRGSDFLCRLILRNLVEQTVIGHHQMRLLTDAYPPLDGDTSSLQALVFFGKTERLDHHPVAQKTPLARVEDPRGDLMQNEFIVPDMDGVTGIGPTLITGHHMNLRGKHVDDLALALVAPLATQNHRAVAGASAFRHDVILR